MEPTSGTVIFARDEIDLIVAFAGCSLDEKPGSNWVQSNGHLPEYVCQVAKAIKKSGKSTSQAIAIALSRIKVWASGKGVDKDTQAKAAAAVAEWEKLRAKSKAKSAAKDVKASRSQPGEILCLSDSVTSFNVETVRRAWSAQTSQWRQTYNAAYPYGSSSAEAPPSYSYIREMWTDYLIVCAEDGDGDGLFKVPYTVDAEGDVSFDTPQPVTMQYVAVKEQEMVGQTISNSELRRLMATVGPCYASATDQVLLSISEKPSALYETLNYRTRTAVDKVLAAKLHGK